jgi:hypothetical protein
MGSHSASGRDDLNFPNVSQNRLSQNSLDWERSSGT